MRLGPLLRMMTFFFGGHARLVQRLVAGVEIGRVGLELARAGVDQAVHRLDARRLALGARIGFVLRSPVHAAQGGDLAVGKADPLGLPQQVGGQWACPAGRPRACAPSPRSANLSMNHGSIFVSSATLGRAAHFQRAFDQEVPVGAVLLQSPNVSILHATAPWPRA
jgi:hypothetical protein